MDEIEQLKNIAHDSMGFVGSVYSVVSVTSADLVGLVGWGSSSGGSGNNSTSWLESSVGLSTPLVKSRFSRVCDLVK
jgi:hypothetical protein